VLGLLAMAGERSGYELARLAEGGIAYLWTPSRSQIYKVLPRLVAAGFARMREVEQRGRPDKALYQLTPEGHAALRSWLEDVEEEPAGGRVVFAVKLFSVTSRRLRRRSPIWPRTGAISSVRLRPSSAWKRLPPPPRAATRSTSSSTG